MSVEVEKKKGLAIVPGSFDPMTYGHVFVVREALKRYEKVVVAVMINDQKNYMFTLEEREKIAEISLRGIENVSVISSRGWLWALARDLGAVAIVKGYRNDADLEYEKKMAEFNGERCPSAETVLIKADPALLDVSSTALRKRILAKESLAELMPQSAIEYIEGLRN